MRSYIENISIYKYYIPYIEILRIIEYICIYIQKHDVLYKFYIMLNICQKSNIISYIKYYGIYMILDDII